MARGRLGEGEAAEGLGVIPPQRVQQRRAGKRVAVVRDQSQAGAGPQVAEDGRRVHRRSGGEFVGRQGAASQMFGIIGDCGPMNDLGYPKARNHLEHVHGWVIVGHHRIDLSG
jgi:hypothetical protein